MEENQPAPQTSETHRTSTKHIVVFGKHDYIVENAERLLSKAGYSTKGFVEVEEAIEYVKMNQVEGIFIGGGVDPHHRIAIKELIDATFPHVRLIDHFGGPATIISEVESALGKA